MKRIILPLLVAFSLTACSKDKEPTCRATDIKREYFNLGQWSYQLACDGRRYIFIQFTAREHSELRFTFEGKGLDGFTKDTIVIDTPENWWYKLVYVTDNPQYDDNLKLVSVEIPNP